MKKNRLNLNGVIIIDKVKGDTSNRVLQKIKRLYNAQKAGHTGTLDPMATGVLPICFGRATKISQYLLDADKEYIATIKLGVETDSGDAEGNVIANCDNIPSMSESELDVLLNDFRGEISQVPPMYSALKHNGQPLYKLAREGITVEIKPRNITIHELELLSFDYDIIKIRVKSSKGTYIRSLAIDIGKKMGCGAHLIGLQRTNSGPFNISQAHQFEDLCELDDNQRLDTLFHVEHVFEDKQSYVLLEHEKEDLYKRGKIGNKPNLNGTVKIYDEDKFVAIAEFETGNLINKKFFEQEILISE